VASATRHEAFLVLHPLEVAHGDAASVGKDVRQELGRGICNRNFNQDYFGEAVSNLRRVDGSCKYTRKNKLTGQIAKPTRVNQILSVRKL